MPSIFLTNVIILYIIEEFTWFFVLSWKYILLPVSCECKEFLISLFNDRNGKECVHKISVHLPYPGDHVSFP